MKKIFVLCLTLVICFSSISAMSETRKNGDFEYEVKGNGTATITGYSGTQKDIILPNFIDGYTITTIGDEAFYLEKEAEASISVTIPETVTSIGEKAFWNRNLHSINLPDGLQYIGAGAFVGCRSCQYRISGDHKVYAVVNGSLYDKTQKSLIAVVVGDDLKVSIPNGIVSIGDYACYEIKYTQWDNTYFVSVSLPTSLEKIGNYAFAGGYLSASAWKSYFPASVVSIGEYAFAWGNFAGNNFGDVIVLPSSLSKMGVGAFKNANAYESGGVYCSLCISLAGNSVLKDIPDEAFYYFDQKKNLMITDLGSVESIGTSSFENATIWCGLPNHITALGNRCFAGAFFMCGDYGNTVTIPGTCEIISEEAFYDAYFSGKKTGELGSLTLEDGISRIESKALIADFTSVSFPASITFIADDALPLEPKYTAIQGTYAERWLQENAYPYSVDGAEQNLDWLNN